jgi:hypothetical protein
MTVTTHTNLSTHSPTFSLASLARVQASVSGTIADRIDAPELQYLSNGQWLSFDPALKFTALEKGGVKAAFAPAASLTLRWSVPFGGHSISTNVVT